MLLKMRVLATAVGIAVASSATPGLAATSIDTTGAFTSNWHPFGQPDTSAYGETFTVGSDNVLNSFSLYLDGQVASTLNFTAYVYAWNGSMITGSALYTSANQIFNGSADNSPVECAFNTGSLSLNSGSQYAAFLFANSGGLANMPSSSSDYTGGNFVYNNAGNNFASLSSTNWSVAQPDVWFKATFNGAVPEPETWALMLLGFGAMGVAMRRDRKKRAAVSAA